jgi:transcriptional regulator of acetoin/glycerol metabolism
VQGCEHFYELFGGMRCAAAPIRDVGGRLVGVLDVSTESRAFGFDAAAVVGVYATSIENRLLQAQSGEHLVLHFQAAPALLGTPMEALAGIDSSGRVVWINATGHSLLGRPSRQDLATAEELFGHSLSQLLSLLDAPSAERMQLPSGLGIWVQATMGLRDGVDFRHAVAWSTAMPPAPAPEQSPVAEQEVPSSVPLAALVAPSLAQTQQRLIEDTLQANGGNVARTARKLGVSRGLVYRHLRR